MPKGILLTAVTVLVCVIFAGDVSAELNWELGAKGGVNWGKLTGDQLSLWLTGEDAQLAGSIGDSKLGFNGGVFVTAFFTPFFGVQVEAMYIQKGGQGAATGTIIYQPDNDNPRPGEFEGTVYAYFDYVEFPVLAVFNFDATDDSKVRLRGFAGPVFAFNVRAEARLEGSAYVQGQDGNYRTEAVDQTEDAGDYVKQFEFAMMFGGAAYWDIGSVDLILEGRWELGLTTLDNTTLNRDIKTSDVSILIGFAYPFGG